MIPNKYTFQVIVLVSFTSQPVLPRFASAQSPILLWVLSHKSKAKMAPRMLGKLGNRLAQHRIALHSFDKRPYINMCCTFSINSYQGLRTFECKLSTVRDSMLTDNMDENGARQLPRYLTYCMPLATGSRHSSSFPLLHRTL